MLGWISDPICFQESYLSKIASTAHLGVPCHLCKAHLSLNFLALKILGEGEIVLRCGLPGKRSEEIGVSLGEKIRKARKESEIQLLKKQAH